jgi:ABC-type lipoprotein release transport system permease subunit
VQLADRAAALRITVRWLDEAASMGRDGRRRSSSLGLQPRSLLQDEGACARAALHGDPSLEQRRGDFLAQRRLQTLLLTGFSIADLLMAVIGIYGLIQNPVATRTPETGIRMATGAQAGEIFRMIIREGLALCLAGLIIGLAGTLWLTHAGSALLYGVAATDPVAFAAVSLLSIATGAAACNVPARRAMKVEPLAALRNQ